MIGCFGLTEPDAEQRPGRDAHDARGATAMAGSSNGTKMWITNGSRAGVAVVWARAEDRIRGFLVPAGTDGFRAVDVHDKLSLVASTTSEPPVLRGLPRSGQEALLPGVDSLRGPLLSCLERRPATASLWGAVGAARACFEAALDYTATRVAFGSPIASRQLVQQELVEMHVALNNGLLIASRIGRLKDEGRLVGPDYIGYGNSSTTCGWRRTWRAARARSWAPTGSRSSTR